MNKESCKRTTLPCGWERCVLPDFAGIVMGQSPNSVTYNQSGDGLPFFQGKAEFGKLYPTIKMYCSQPKKIAKRGATLLSVRAPVGPTNLAQSECCIGRGLAALYPCGSIEPKFLLYLFKSIEPEFSRQGTGSTFNAVTKGFIENLEFDLPPLPEQNRIVSKIEELFSELDKGIENLKTAREQLNLYRQAVLKHAFEGKLTAQWRERNKDKLKKPELLLARIKQKRAVHYEWQLQEWRVAAKEWEAKGKLGKKPLRPRKPKDVDTASNAGSLAVLPTAWRWTTVSEISDLVTDGTHHTPDYTRSGLPFISVKDVRHERVSFDDCKFISRDDHEALIQRCHPQLGDLLITKSGTIGRLAIVPDKEFSLFVSVALVKIQSALVYISSRWLRYAFEYHIMGLNINQQIKGGLLKNYHLEDLRLAKLPLCDIHEQKELVRLVEEKLSVLENLNATLDQQLVRANSLRQSILKKAFAGQLAKQDPNDESASVLLNRIKAENEHASKKGETTRYSRRKRIPK